MKKRLEHYWRYSLLALSCVLCAGAFAQVDTIESRDTGLVHNIKDISTTDFDMDLLPAQGIYGQSWSARNIDSPAYDHKTMKLGYKLDLVEEDCYYVHPFKGRVTSKYGWRRSRWHKGIDIDLDIGDPVYAAFDGIVRIQRYNPGGFGNYVMVRHYNGLETLYAHLSEALVLVNQTVRAGQIIGYGGSTGRSTGSHLHFQTMLMGQAFDPSRIIDFNNFTLKRDKVIINNTWFPYIKNGNTRANIAPPNARRYHKIRRGNTLSGIARRYGTTVNSICRLNRISRTTTLRIGRTLRVR